jgi:dUTP pyrophosphatase
MSDSPDHVPVRVKRLDGNQDIALPSYETEGSSGLDLRAAVNGELTLHPGEIKLVPTGLAISLPVGYEAQIRPRSGLALKHGVDSQFSRTIDSITGARSDWC